VTSLDTTHERADLLETLEKHRGFLRYAARDLTDAQAAQRTTVSALTLGGLVKHVAETEHAWIQFAIGGAESMAASVADYENQFNMLPGETLTRLLERYAEVARETSEFIISVPDLDADHPLPRAPWFEPGARWSARRVLLHVIAETAQHAGHADIIRESLDGARTMG
jgi:uncharacterized damage-inducible protein DinB